MICTIRARSDFVGPKDKKSPPEKKVSFKTVTRMILLIRSAISNYPPNGGPPGRWWKDPLREKFF